MLGWPGSGEARGHDKKSTDAAGKDNSTLKGKKLPRSPPGFICAAGNGPAIGGAQILLGKQGSDSATRVVSLTETNVVGAEP